MDENTNEVEVEVTDEDLAGFDEAWDEDVVEGTEEDDEPVVDEKPDQDEDGNPDPDHEEDSDEPAEDSEEPGAETETGNQRFKIKYNGTEEEYDLDQMTTLAQKGRNYDHVVEERDSLRGKAKDAEGQLAFLKDLADRAGLTVEEQIDRTRALWLMNDEFDKGNEISEAEALLRVQREKKAVEQEKKEEPQNENDAIINRFLAVYPNVQATDIPTEVWDAAQQMGDLLGAYQAWEIKRLKEENEKVKKEAHNEQNAKRSTGPLKSTGTKRVKDDFDEGWDSEF